nr:unnamed protein product [Callosobruchus chinensis]
MNRLEETRPLTKAELEEIASNIDLEAEMEYESKENSDNEADQEFMKENVSETEDSLEIQREEESDEEPAEPQDEAVKCSGAIYTAKSGLQWNRVPFVKTRRAQKNIIKSPGITAFSKEANTILDIFNLFLTKDMKEMICRHTNEEADRYLEAWNAKNPENKKEWLILEKDELDSFLGVLLKAGALRCRKESTREMWSTNTTTRRSFFTAALPRDRFEQLSRFLRFDDTSTGLRERKRTSLQQ